MVCNGKNNIAILYVVYTEIQDNLYTYEIFIILLPFAACLRDMVFGIPIFILLLLLWILLFVQQVQALTWKLVFCYFYTSMSFSNAQLHVHSLMEKRAKTTKDVRTKNKNKYYVVCCILYVHGHRHRYYVLLHTTTINMQKKRWITIKEHILGALKTISISDMYMCNLLRLFLALRCFWASGVRLHLFVFVRFCVPSLFYLMR